MATEPMQDSVKFTASFPFSLWSGNIGPSFEVVQLSQSPKHQLSAWWVGPSRRQLFSQQTDGQESQVSWMLFVIQEAFCQRKSPAASRFRSCRLPSWMCFQDPQTLSYKRQSRTGGASVSPHHVARRHDAQNTRGRSGSGWDYHNPVGSMRTRASCENGYEGQQGLLRTLAPEACYIS